MFQPNVGTFCFASVFAPVNSDVRDEHREHVVLGDESPDLRLVVAELVVADLDELQLPPVDPASEFTIAK